MGASGKWFKSLITPKPPQPSNNQQDKAGDKGRKKLWRPWKNSSEGLGSSASKMHNLAGLESSDSSCAVDDAFAAAMAALVRAAPKHFKVVKQEWAAIRIQTTFRGFLARRAMKALKAVVRIQAIFRGRQVRKQAAVTLRCMQALVRVQARVRAQGANVSLEGSKLLDEHPNADLSKQAKQGWCDSPGTVDEVRAKVQRRQEGAIKRERAMLYSLSKQQSRSCASSPNVRENKSTVSLKHHSLDKNSIDSSWLERWMAAKPWETRLMEEIHTDQSEMPQLSRKSEDNILSFRSCSSEREPVKERRNNITTKILARPPIASEISGSSSASNSESMYDESSPSTSSKSVSPTIMSSNILMADRAGDCYYQKPSYLNLTESTKAKQKVCRLSSPNMQRHMMDDFRFCSKSMTLSNGDTRSSTGSDTSLIFYKDLYPHAALGRHDCSRNPWHQRK